MTNSNKTKGSQFRPNQTVFDHTTKKKVRFQSYNRDNSTAKVSLLTGHDKETGRVTTETYDVLVSKLSVYRKRKPISRKNNKPLEIKIKYFNDDLIRIKKIDVGDWIDLRAAENVKLSRDESALISLGVAMELPEGYEAHILPRGSTFKNFKIIETNSKGIVDESYKGDDDKWFFPAYAMRDTEIKFNDRICQFRIQEKMPEVRFVEVDSLGNDNRGGHGSTGIK